jgi:hypothetical protein
MREDESRRPRTAGSNLRRGRENPSDKNFLIFSSGGGDCWATKRDCVSIGGLLRRMTDSPRWFSLERKDAITENPLFPHCLPAIPQRFFCNRPQGEYVVGE